MAPKGRGAKAKELLEENGKEKRTRNVKATSYKDLSDSDDEKGEKVTSEEESNSEEEKPIKKRGSKRKATARRKARSASASESESEYRSSEGYSDDESTRKMRKPVRSLRASKSTSYKDLSNSEDDSETYSSRTSGKQKARKSEKSASKSKEEKSSDAEIPSGESEEDESVGSPEKDADNENESTEKPEVADSSVKKKETHSKSSSDEEEPLKSESKESPGKSDDKTGKGENISEETSDEKESKRTMKTDRPEHELSDEEEDEKVENIPKKRGRSKKSEANETSVKKPKPDDQPKLNRTDSDYDSIDFSCAATTSDGKMWNFKISSWNVAGLKAWIKKNGLDFIKYEKPDVLCLQETKCSEKKLPPEAKVEGYHSYWHSGDKEGYAGVALLCKQEPLDVKYGIDVEEFDNDGRVITAEFENFFIVNAYVPNAGQGLKSLPHRLNWDPAFRGYLKKLDEKKPVILCGDLNVAHAEIDLKNPKTNTKSAGFTPQEREGMTELLKEGFVDSFRHLYPDKTDAYSFWSYFNQARSRNIGWRLDYFILSERLTSSLCDNVMRSDVYGSDHCPITLFVSAK